VSDPTSHRPEPPLQRLLVLASTLTLGGGERVLASLLEALAAAGCRVELCFLKQPGTVGERLISAGMPATALGLADTRSPAALLGLLRLLRKLQPDLLYIQDHHDCLFWGRLAASLAGFLPALSPVHSSAQGRLRAFRLHNRVLLGLSPHLATLGDWQEAALAGREGLVRGDWTVIPNPVPDIEAFAAAIEAAPRPLAERRELVCVAALRPEKRLERLLDLLAVLRTRRPVRLTLIGEGAERAALEARASALGLGDALRLLGAREDVAALLPSFDLFVLVSEEEALPVSVLEALISGLPVAAPPHGALPELLADGRGLLLAGDSPARWAMLIDRYLEALPPVATRQAFARELAVAHSPARFAARYGRLLARLGGQG